MRLIPLIFFLAVACLSGNAMQSPIHNGIGEKNLEGLELPPELVDHGNQISGLTWFGDQLVLLRQFPTYKGGKSLSGNLILIEREEIEKQLGSGKEISYSLLPIDDGGVEEKLLALRPPENIEGFEAMVIADAIVFLTIELSGPMQSYLVKGTIKDSGINLLPNTLMPIPDPNLAQGIDELRNMGYETLVLHGKDPVAIYEANCTESISQPVGHKLGVESHKFENVSLPGIPFRITDATEMADNRFWLLNYFYFGEASLCYPNFDSLQPEDGLPLENRGKTNVLRLVEFRMEEGQISRTSAAPVVVSYFKEVTNNWEGLVRYTDQSREGFLIASDAPNSKFKTELKFVPIVASR